MRGQPSQSTQKRVTYPVRWRTLFASRGRAKKRPRALPLSFTDAEVIETTTMFWYRLVEREVHDSLLIQKVTRYKICRYDK